MQTMTQNAEGQLIRLARNAENTAAPLGGRSRVLAALIWLVRMLFVRPVGRRAREERLGALDGRILRDIGLQRADVQAAAWGIVPLRDALRRYPSTGPLVPCSRPDFALVLVRLSEAA